MPRSPSRRAAHRRTAARLRALDLTLEPVLAEVAAARDALDARTGDDVTLDERRAAHRRLRLAYVAADALLREATREAQGRSRHEWMAMRRRLSALDTARQHHLMAEQDELAVLPLGSVQGPGRYGVDVEAVLRRGEGPSDLPVTVPAQARTASGFGPARHGLVAAS